MSRLRAAWPFALAMQLGGVTAAAQPARVVDAAGALRLARAYHERGPIDSAIERYHQAVRLSFQQPDSVTLIAATIGIAELFGQLDSLRYAMRYSRAVLDLPGAGRDARGMAMIQVGRLLHRTNEADSARAWFERASALQRDGGDVDVDAVALAELGTHSYRSARRAASAPDFFRRAVATARGARASAFVRNAQGEYYQMMGQPDSALPLHLLALALARSASDRRGEARSLRLIGQVHETFGQRDSAVLLYRQALTIERRVGDVIAQGYTHTRLGRAFVDVSRFDSALVHIDTAVIVGKATEDSFLLLAAYAEAGRYFQRTGDSENSRRYLTESIRLANSLDALALKGEVLRVQGRNFEEGREPRHALDTYRQALALGRQLRQSSLSAWALLDMGRAYAAMYEADSALVTYEEALRLARSSGDQRAELRILTGIAYALHHAFRPRRITASLPYYDAASAVAAAMRRRGGDDADRVNLAEIESQRYEQWALAWLEQGTTIGQDRAALASLAAIERGRAQALLDLRQASRHIPPGADFAADGARLANAVTASGAVAIAYMLAGDTLIAWLARPGQSVAISRTRIQRRRLDAMIAAIRALVWADSARAGIDTSQAQPSRQSRLYARMVDSLIALGDDAILAQAARVLLPAEFMSGVPAGAELVIVPYGPLHLVPFAALLVGPQAEPLGMRFAIRYLPALGMHRERAATLAQRVQYGSALVVGNPIMPADPDNPGESLPSLDATELEARSIAALLKVTPLIGSAATESVVTTRLRDPVVVHLATHGRAYNAERAGRASFVAFAADAGRSDGLLTVGELLANARITLDSTRLVVLSACQTALGDLTNSEGTVGLQRAFLAKGAHSILVSQWSVDEDATRLLMERFYHHWLSRAPVTKAMALREAQRDVRGRQGYEKPFFWAGFQLVGDR